MTEETTHFRQLLKLWGQVACSDWGYPAVDSAWVDRACVRLPSGLQDAVAAGVASGTIITDGTRFSLLGLSPGKGPYAWFSRNNSSQSPAPNWEYFVQVAEYVRLKSELDPKGYRILFEDDLMDISVYKGPDLVVCCEVKEKSSQLDSLVRGIKTYAGSVDLGAPDRGNDPLRKAKYLVRRKPRYFSALAIGKRLEFALTYPDENSFVLREDLIWLQ